MRRGLPASGAAAPTRKAARGRRHWPLGAALLTALVLGLVLLANLPVVTTQGVNFVVQQHSIPLYMKALDFVDRDIHYRKLAAEIVQGATTDELKARAVFEWTRTNIRPTPPGFPIVDDHVWHIIVRGYGQHDQLADVFTTLVSYAGVPAYFIFIGPHPKEEISLSLVRIDGRWRVADVFNGVVFLTRKGQWATAEDLSTDRDYLIAQGPSAVRNLPYASFFANFHAPLPPDLTRPDMQRLGARTWFQVRRVFNSNLRQWEAARRRGLHHRRRSRKQRKPSYVRSHRYGPRS